MGAIADGFIAYARPLIDQTDGSLEQMKKAMAVSQCCFNLSLLPEDRLDQSIAEMQQSLQMDDEDFKEFRSSIIIPMIERHKQMFPMMHGQQSMFPSRSSPLLRPAPTYAAPSRKKNDTDPYAPCPCNSGKKYKFCCRDKGR